MVCKYCGKENALEYTSEELETLIADVQNPESKSIPHPTKEGRPSENAGYDEGYRQGEKKGYHKGIHQGQEAGYDEGYRRGEKSGYDKGYRQARKEDNVKYRLVHRKWIACLAMGILLLILMSALTGMAAYHRGYEKGIIDRNTGDTNCKACEALLSQGEEISQREKVTEAKLESETEKREQKQRRIKIQKPTKRQQTIRVMLQ